jgi:hypothetical protein
MKMKGYVVESEDVPTGPIPFKIRIFYGEELLLEHQLDTGWSDQKISDLCAVWAREFNIPVSQEEMIISQIKGMRDDRMPFR